MKKAVTKGYVFLILLFLYAPIFVLIAFSFNESKSRANFTGFTFHWYEELFKDNLIMTSLGNTLLIAVLASVFATILGTAAALGIKNMKKRARGVCMNITYMPVINPEIVMGISMMLLFVFICQMFDWELGMVTVLIAHITFCVPYVILNVLPKLRQMDQNTYEAALDLGCTPFSAFFKVVIPEILPGILSGFLMAFTFSLDDFIITHFTKGAGINTLSTLIYSEVRRGIRPSMYALSTVIFVVVLVVLLIANFRKQPEKD